ncbi:MAG: hypothetical protein IIW22_01915 [Erysipelotrichaceae bacterium]|nr:hypothetical protein [Erysipelotrichaceae bacterium]
MKKNYGFMLEMVIMLALFVSMIVVMSGIYARSLAESQRGKHLNDAVVLASNGAEVFLAGNDEEEFGEIFGSVDEVKDEEVTVRFDDDLEPAENGKMKLTVKYREEPDFVYGHFEVFYEEELIYELDTGYALKEKGNE